ncbi:Ryanodine receptor 3 [Phytophthora pseudosyringae]|uniref:Ryanodine receptor 3 n=1 Tax=Phytophthora pseudosyringae TaxID=221518 RepID=A0A8T1V962_9STRA|nr:Ryanodine receptor 3 [Phytophthora pseudosyringae]
MVAQDREVGCFGISGNSSHVTHQGLLQYQSKDDIWKERWFVLDGVKSALVKCNTTNHLPAGSYGSVLGGDVLIADARPLSGAQTTALSSDGVPAGEEDASAVGFEVTTPIGTKIVFRTKSLKEQGSWLTAINKTASGFASGVADRLADRELLAGKYSLVRELGRGASGIVSLCTWQGKPFAIKKFVPQKSKGVPNRRAVPVATGRRTSAQASHPNAVPDDVRREVALLKKASNLPYVIRLHDVILDTENRDYYLVMEYMGGGAIAEWDGSRKCYVSSRAKSAASGSACLLDESTVRTYVTNLVLAIQALHLNNLAHRDIKPENLMANEQHTLCKLGDLGVAHYFKEENGELRDEEDVDAIELWDINQGPVPSPVQQQHSSVDGSKKHLRGMIKSTKGTYQFLPPESLNGDAYCAFKADIWAIGVTMYALLFGSLPYYSSDVSELFDKIENDPLEFPASCEDNEAKDLLAGILEKDPEKRITLEGILQHRWTHRNIDSKSLRKQVNALKQAPTLSIEDHELGSAVSVHQSRFLKMAAAIRHDTLNDLAKEDTADIDTATPQTDEEYKPNPIDTKETALPRWFQPHRELVAAQMHFDWCRGKSMAGWKYGDVRDDAHLVHPCMLPMRALDDTARSRNFASVDEIIKCVVALGVQVAYRRPSKLATRDVPFPVEHVNLSWDIVMLIDLLAENSHEVWATEYAASGWRLGAEFDEVAKTHPSLKPYMLLDEHDKTLTREGVTSVLKSCIYLGCKFSISHRGRKS